MPPPGTGVLSTPECSPSPPLHSNPSDTCLPKSPRASPALSLCPAPLHIPYPSSPLLSCPLSHSALDTLVSSLCLDHACSPLRREGISLKGRSGCPPGSTVPLEIMKLRLREVHFTCHRGGRRAWAPGHGPIRVLAPS